MEDWTDLVREHWSLWLAGSVAVATVRLWNHLHGVRASDGEDPVQPFRVLADVVFWPLITAMLLYVGLFAAWEKLTTRRNRGRVGPSR